MGYENFGRRVEKLEKDKHSCRECDLRPKKLHVYYPEEGGTADVGQPEFCPSCGAQIEAALIRVEYDDAPEKDLR